MKVFDGKVEFGYSSLEDGNLDFRFDGQETVNARREKFFEAKGINPEKSVVMIAEHKNHFAFIQNKDAGKSVWSPDDQYFLDILITKEKDLTLGLLVADCIAIALFDKVNETLVLAHLGSKNLASSTLDEAVKLIKKEAAKEPEIYAVTSPFIKKCCYKFDKIPEHLASLEDYFVKKEDFYFLDTEKILKDQLAKNGIKNFNVSPLCSYHDGFPSHKRSQEKGEAESRMLAYARMI